MGHHKLSKGKDLISGIIEIGKVLGYIAKSEFPIDKKRKNSPAIDVAWLSDEDHDFPLMIFEIESRVIGAIANNPLKVFGLPNESFEKPLFFFHLFLETPDRSTKNDTLKNMFGLYNYRTYDLTKEEEYTRLLCDIFSQHRRLYKKIDLESIITILKRPIWGNLNLEKILIHIEENHFLADFLKTYGTYYIKDPDFKNHYLRFMRFYMQADPKKTSPQDYGTYWGYEWADPIHYAILINTDSERQKDYLQKFITWQENVPYFSMIGPHFRLSRDYDEFILCMAPPFLAFIAALMKSYEDAILYITEQLKIILEALTDAKPTISFFSALWLLHIAAACKSEKYFNLSKNIINNNGGISERFLYSPPNTIPLDSHEGVEEYKNWTEGLQENSILVPELITFKKQLDKTVEENRMLHEDVFDFALDVLIDPGVHSHWSQRIIYHLIA